MIIKKSSLQERKQRELDQRRKDILKVVRKMIVKGGAREITMRKVADEAGFSTTVVYALFSDKATMIANAVDDDIIRLQKLLRAAIVKGATALERVRLASHAYVENGLQHPDQYFLVFMERRPAAPPETSTLEFGNPEHDPYALVRSLTVGLVEEGIIAADEAGIDVITQVIWEGLHGMTSLRVSTGDDPWIERIGAQAHLDFLLDILLLGIVHRFRGAHSAPAIESLSRPRAVA